jgi:hypothetical protein
LQFEVNEVIASLEDQFFNWQFVRFTFESHGLLSELSRVTKFSHSARSFTV